MAFLFIWKGKPQDYSSSALPAIAVYDHSFQNIVVDYPIFLPAFLYISQHLTYRTGRTEWIEVDKHYCVRRQKKQKTYSLFNPGRAIGTKT